MKSAEELAREMAEIHCLLIDGSVMEKRNAQCVALIRARDKEIVEACKAQAVGYMRIKGLCAHEYEPHDCPVCQNEMRAALDFVLRDLEGGHNDR